MYISFTYGILYALLLNAVESRQIKWSGIKCATQNETLYHFRTCAIKAIRRDVTELSVYIEVGSGILNDLQLSLQLRRRGAPGNNKALYAYHIDCCAFMRNKRRNPLAALFYQLFGFQQNSNINHTCPYNHDIFLEHYAFNSEYVNMLPVPAGHYIVHTIWYSNKVIGFIINVNIEVRE